MTALSNSSLRTRLRDDTADVHAALDAFVSSFALTTPDGLARFLWMQMRALEALAPLVRGSRCGDAMLDLATRAADDLSTLGARHPAPCPRPRQALHPLSVEYVVAGSRLGTQVLKRRWASAGDASVRAAHRYFDGPDHLSLWRAFLYRTRSMPADGALADRVVTDTRTLFSFYTMCAESAARVQARTAEHA